ncbi:MAG: chromosomal replication initiator protein DnaA [Elusimicrobia bacterium]|nr:chromosomal replication initiator protein DnaA [Elusimicrobiota bacterium]
MSVNIDHPVLPKEAAQFSSTSEALFLQELWEKICNRLKNEMGIESYDLWFKPVKALSFSSDVPGKKDSLILEAPNKIFSDWIKDHEKSNIESYLKEMFSKELEIEIVLANDELEPLPQTNFRELPAIQKPKEPYDPSFSVEQFNPKYTFETFVEGETNRFAKAAAEGVSKEPGTRFNPLFIYGDVGLGKTHLMHALGQAIFQHHPKSRVLYISSEKFINEFINSLRFERPADFRNKYRNLDCLLIDDIQFLMGKGRSEEEFFFTFNTLFDSRKQIVISSDRPPKEMGALQERLISRFEWGVVADVQPPDLETRIAILRKKAESEKIFVPEDVILFIASQVKSNIRELEGALIRIAAFASLMSAPLTVDAVRSTLKDILKKEDVDRPISMEIIQEVVAKHFNLEIKELKSKKRTDAIAWPRQITMYLARVLTDLSTTEIGNFFGGKDHTTVLHACEKVKAKLAESPFVSSLVNKITQEIKNENMEDR